TKNSRISRFPFAIAVLVFTATAAFLLFPGKDGGDKSDPINPESNGLDSSSIQLNPSVELVNGTDLIWQIPASPKAVVFLAHGCGGRASHFWDKSPTCSHCIGLPEERAIVLHALSRSFAAVAISSRTTCWSFGDEIPAVNHLLRRWISDQNLQNLPVFALGASSGGYFVSALAVEFTSFRAIALMISEGVYSRLRLSGNYPPTIFVHMPKDERRKTKIEEYMAAMRGKGIDVDEIQCLEFPLTPRSFADRIPGIDLRLSAELFESFKEKGFIDGNGFMTDDGRAVEWLNVLEEKQIRLPDPSLKKHIQEEMNLAFAYHEMTSLPSPQIFHWFESHMS
ncbi:hypothetical protein M569_07438, partial [Genlisea aurea]